ncbi:MAG: SAM-dependent methyltransferase [Planctomycetes bacterium]|nr:SAM-dependent methyltransferase [Planctomycetota bacterium]
MTASETFLQHLSQSCGDDTFVRLTLSSPTGSRQPKRVQVRLVELKGQRHLSFTRKHERNDTQENLPVADGVAEVGRMLPRDYRSATLLTTAADWQLQCADGSEAKLIRHKPSTKASPTRAHDKDKPTLLGEPARRWLQALDIVYAQGRPKRNLAHKHAQIDRYAELLLHLLRDAGLEAGSGPLRIADVGCGKGHLTFAAWHVASHVLRREAEVLGVEARDDLVAAATRTAEGLGARGLRFATGDIADAALPELDALVALHACNTATDHAIRRGVEASVPLIVTAPCCHQEVRPQLQSPEPLAPALKHGLLAERMAEWATDALRALVLEWCGYRVKVVDATALPGKPAQPAA